MGQTVMSESAFNDATGAILTFAVLAVAMGTGVLIPLVLAVAVVVVGGFAEVTPERCTVLADEALPFETVKKRLPRRSTWAGRMSSRLWLPKQCSSC